MCRKLISWLLVVITMLTLASSCRSSQNQEAPSETAAASASNAETESPSTTAPLVEGEPVKISPDGSLVWTILGVVENQSFAGVTAKEGNVILTVYAEARNQSESDIYVSSAYLKTSTDPIAGISAEDLPEGCSAFGGLIGAGKRRVYCVSFEEPENWFRLVFDYVTLSGTQTSNVITKSKVTKGELMKGNPAYPLDTRTDAAIKADFDKLFEKYYTAQWGTPSESQAKAYEDLLVRHQVGYQFSNIDYQSKVPNYWDPSNHLSNLKSLISCYGEERLKTDTAARESVLGILDHWLYADYTCTTNWWHNEISTPKTMAAIGLMLSPYLNDHQVEKMDEIIGRGTLRGSLKATNHTGANLCDVMQGTILHGLFLGDYGLVYAASERMAAEIRIAKQNEEGIQADGSFFQHGNMLCSAGSYGGVFIAGMKVFITELYGTCFALPNEKIELFIDHLLDDQSLFHRQFGTNYFSIGRSATSASGSSNLYQTAKALSEIEGIYRREDLLRYCESFTDAAKISAALRYFPLSYSLVNKNSNYYMAVRGAHEGFILTEVANSENVLGYNLSYGANTCYMYYGNEYQGIGAVLDYAMYPGVTTYHEDDASLLARWQNDYEKTWGSIAYQKSTYRGTHCDGKTDDSLGIGALYMELVNDGLDGKLSFVTYNGMTVALGAGLDCTKDSNTTEIRTSIDQCRYNGAKIGGEALALNGGSVSVTGNVAVCNGAFAYYNLGGGILAAEAKTMTGSPSRNSLNQPEELVSADVFSLYYSYGADLENASYAYAVYANGDGKAPATADGLPIKSITNTELVQAVEFTDGHSVTIFHAAGAHTLSTGETVSSDKADIIIR